MDVVRKILAWCQRPITRKDRLFAAVVGAIGGIWIGVIICVVLAIEPIELHVLGLWALSGSSICALLGAFFPRLASVLLFPLTLLGFSL
ncbi:hypothetical protein [Phytopseudomonas punonensis]|uniref:Uncharacterized protein n=1 Tax=Phytopseudomonas punonensis TaxID=1220495 RepID=A0A1M7AJ49_9GAMM|nr:hypothetical protein [Pseudomonas punonensis]SHL42748.1 hypothetical protein SAMN05216288_1910 [Pseudomonas punonensis]